MVASPDTAARRAAIVEAARGVFLRYGYRKTSMDDIARAAGLSRQGLYLHFATKELLFEAVVRQVLAATRAASQSALARTDLPVDERLLAAFTALHGEVIGRQGVEHLDELLATAEQLLGPVVEELERGFAADIARELQDAGVAGRWADAGVSATDLAAQLCATSYGLKHGASSPADYHDRMRIAVRMVCLGAPTHGGG
jgi:AcrR family transcriptional regulator